MNYPTQSDDDFIFTAVCAALQQVFLEESIFQML